MSRIRPALWLEFFGIWAELVWWIIIGYKVAWRLDLISGMPSHLLETPRYKRLCTSTNQHSTLLPPSKDPKDP
jgi:hypothetical protein